MIMNWLETTLVTLGVSLDIFAAMACKGAQLSKIEKKPLVILCVLFAVWQPVAHYIGSAAGAFLRKACADQYLDAGAGRGAGLSGNRNCYVAHGDLSGNSLCGDRRIVRGLSHGI